MTTTERDAILRNRAFELQDLEIWCARNASRLHNAHDCYYYQRQLEAMCNPRTTDDWEESVELWDSYVRRVRQAFKI